MKGVACNNIADVGVDFCPFGGVITWHIDAWYMGGIVDGLVCMVASYFCGNLMFLWVSGDDFPNEGDDPS